MHPEHATRCFEWAQQQASHIGHQAAMGRIQITAVLHTAECKKESLETADIGWREESIPVERGEHREFPEVSVACI